MIDGMPRPRPPGLHREVNRHGRVVWYYREGRGPRIRIKGEFGSDEFKAQYEAAKNGTAASPARARPDIKSLAWLIGQYRNSAAYLIELKQATRDQRDNIFKHIVASAGATPYAAITKQDVQKGIDRRKDKPSAAKHFLQSMRGLYRWAVEAGHAERDPTDGLKVSRKKTDGFIMWPEEWCAMYEARWPLGKRERVWYEVIYCTGLRRSDAVRVGRQHVKNGRGMIRTLKNDETAYFIVSDRLQAALDAGPTGDLTWIVGARGKPLTKESFGNYFREACDAAGIPGSAHGIRKTRATIEAESGASGPRLDALFGWKTGSNTSAIYIRKANRAKLAFGGEG